MLKLNYLWKSSISIMLIILLSVPNISFAEENAKSAYFLPLVAEQPHTNSDSKTIYQNKFYD